MVNLVNSMVTIWFVKTQENNLFSVDYPCVPGGDGRSLCNLSVYL